MCIRKVHEICQITSFLNKYDIKTPNSWMLITVMEGTNLFLVIQKSAEKKNAVFTREFLFRKMQLICLVLPEGGSWKTIKLVFCLFVCSESSSVIIELNLLLFFDQSQVQNCKVKNCYADGEKQAASFAPSSLLSHLLSPPSSPKILNNYFGD